MSSRMFIERPIFASVLSIVIVLIGLLALQNLPIAQFPPITPPTVQIEADYPGATAEVVATSVARPIEVQLPGIDHLLYFDSTSTGDGHMVLRLTFEVGTDIDIATVQAQNREKLAEPQLPQEVIRQGISVKKVSPDLLNVIFLQSDDPRYDRVFLSNYALINVVDRLKLLPGVGDIQIFGQQNYSMRIVLNPERMTRFSLTPTDIAGIIRDQNRDFPAGIIGRAPAQKGTVLTLPILTLGRLTEVNDFEELIVRALPDGSIVRLRDVARIELGSQAYGLEGRIDGKPSTTLLTFLAPGANALKTVGRINREMEQIAKTFPPGIRYIIPYDTTKFIEVSIKEVVQTLGEALLLVVLVVYLFLQNWRATLIPAIAVPVSLIGTFAGMVALDFSINTLTLFGMVLAIGIVVDDAIVVVENVERHMKEEGLSPKQAAIKAMEEVSGPVIAIVLVLASVFVPVAFLPGITGQLYKQFALTIALSVAISGLVALTLSPALCALLLQPHQGARKGVFGVFNRMFETLTRRYGQGLVPLIRRPLLSMTLFGALLLGTYGLFQTIPAGFLPDEDQGYIVLSVQLPDGASNERTDAVVKKLEAFYKGIPATTHVISLTGLNFVFGSRGSNQATMFVPFKLWDERPNPQDQAPAILGQSYQFFGTIPEAFVLAFNPPPIRGIGNAGGFTAQLQDPNGRDLREFASTVQSFIAKTRQAPELQAANTIFRVSVPHVYAHINRERIKSLGVPISDVFDTLQAYFGNMYINDFVKFGRVYRVQTEAPPDYRSSPEDFAKIYVHPGIGSERTMIPLDTVVTAQFVNAADPITHFNGINTALVMGGAAPGYSSGQALDALERVAADVLAPNGYGIDWSGVSFQERKVGGQSSLAFVFGLVMVFLVLAALYESWSVPFSIILAVPFGIFGAMLAVWLRGQQNDVYFQIGLVTLIGLAVKNAILIVEFANQRVAGGQPVVDAALDAARLRFRPIIMTSMAFILGVLPLVRATGAGAASRHSIGTGVFGGMLAATFLAIFFVPLFFLLIRRKTSAIPVTPTKQHAVKTDGVPPQEEVSQYV
ncbi:MAG TPA: multidrug efflux RND transporter permease subunit [Nitrospiraceae bacterium]|nr:multidrug efflux RND transporter permease subunit [Nitrospiraceae bacterium]